MSYYEFTPSRIKRDRIIARNERITGYIMGLALVVAILAVIFIG